MVTSTNVTLIHLTVQETTKKIGDNTDCTYRFDKNHFLKGVDHF